MLSFSGINYWLKSQLLDITEVGEYAQFWLGATTDVISLFNIYCMFQICCLGPSRPRPQPRCVDLASQGLRSGLV